VMGAVRLFRVYLDGAAERVESRSIGGDRRVTRVVEQCIFGLRRGNKTDRLDLLVLRTAP
jgi:hypothetical protein